MDRIDIYISVNDMIKLFTVTTPSGRLEVSSNTTEDDSYSFFINLKNLFFTKSTIHLDSLDVFENSENMIIKHLRKLAGTYQILDFNEFEYLDNEEYQNEFKPNLIQFRKDANLDSKKGFLKINCDVNAKEKSKSIFDAHVVTTFKNDIQNKFSDWSMLHQIKLPSNSVIIADYYILKEDGIKNLLSILKNIIPTQIESNFPFHITILGNEDEAGINNLALLKEFIQSKSNIYLNVYSVSKIDLHDRFIISNYWFLNIGHSLDLLNNNGNIKGNKNTSIFIHGFAGHASSLYFDLRKYAKNIIKDKSPLFSSFPSNSKNRLLY